MKLRFPVRILVVDRSPAEAAGLVASLRRAKYEVKPKLVQDLATARTAIRDFEWDIILVGHQLESCPVIEILDELRHQACELPVIVLDEIGQDNLEARDRLLRAGVHDIVPRNESLMLEHTVRRELAALDNRRLIRNMQRHQHNEEQTLQWLIGMASGNIAVTSGDDIIAANDAFLQLFGLDGTDLPFVDGLLECAAASERNELRRFLEAGGADRNRPVQIELQGHNRRYGDFALMLDLAPAAFHGQTGRRIIATPLQEAEQVETAPVTPQTVIVTEQLATPLTVVQGGKVSLQKQPVQSTKPAARIIQEESGRLLTKQEFLSLIDEACHSISHRTDRVGIVYTDLDDFAGLKEHVGITGVVKVMDKVIARLFELCPEHAKIARISDDDFAILIFSESWEDVVAAYEKIDAGICGAIYEIENRSVMVSVGVGLTGLLDEDTDPEKVLERAFAASLSESHPITGVREKDPEEEDMESMMQELVLDLADGMQDGRLFLVYQPVVRLRGNPVELYEVFMRFRNTRGEMVPPRQFLDAADASGFGADLNLWLVEKVIQVLGQQVHKGRRTRLMVKVTDQAVRDIRLPLAARSGIKKYGFSPEQLIFEVCEMTSTNQVKATRAMMHAMRGLHCGTAIEHFGVTRNPFHLLNHITADYLTLASTVVNDIASDEKAVQRVKNMSTRARKMGKTTCAEYVDDAASVSILYEAGVDFMQGYYIQPPAPHLDFEFSMMVG